MNDGCDTETRQNAENFWIHQLVTMHPFGLNDKVTGIHAAFRGFEHWKDTVGKEPGLPSTEGTLGNLKNDQLFFLAQSQMSCRKKCEYSPDVHSPARSRIQGSLSNFSAFHNAFDCKVGDVYRPKEKCDVWIT
ncbi:peptidase family m13 domain-containing protein [Ditylenchus destructor]|uniref:Peptidase family m13 domain-containing protein n=1 Tax=Ditylenchus destructor TaxID=166010 RepID=A0AAD4QXB7_9BILA|nr:peptidase family m13 domain-containing protein [Ditylenchus destructor]